jgi:hypothetical protein
MGLLKLKETRWKEPQIENEDKVLRRNFDLKTGESKKRTDKFTYWGSS